MRFLQSLLLLIALIGLKPHTVKSKNNTQTATRISGVTFIYASEKLKNKIQLTKAKVDKKGMLQRARLNLSNLTNQRIDLEYRTQWLDEDGFEVGDKTIWKQVTFYSNEQTTLRFMGKQPDAHSLKIIIRYPHDNISRNRKK